MTTKTQTDNTCAVLIKLRLKHEYNRGEVAAGVGIQRTRYGQMEVGTSTLYLDEVFALAKFYKMKASELVALIEAPGEISAVERYKATIDALTEENVRLNQKLEAIRELQSLKKLIPKP